MKVPSAQPAVMKLAVCSGPVNYDDDDDDDDDDDTVTCSKVILRCITHM